MEQRQKESLRSIEEISHLFLSGTLDNKSVEASLPKGACGTTDIPPRAVPRFARPELIEEPPSTSLTRNSFFVCSSDTLRPERTVITAHLGLELARRGFRVALVETSRNSPNLMDLLGPAAPGRPTQGSLHNLTLGFWDSEGGLGDSLSMFTALYRDADVIVVNSTPDVSGIESFVWLLNPFYVVLTTPERVDLMTAYQSLKAISGSSSSERLGLLIADDRSTNTAEPAFRVVSNMVQKFLCRELIFVGSLPDRFHLTASLDPSFAAATTPPDPSLATHIVRLADTLVTRSGALR